jgi:hypothetical protein
MKRTYWIILIALLFVVVGYYSFKTVNENRLIDGNGNDTTTELVYLYYYNEFQDMDEAGNTDCSPNAVLPVERRVDKSLANPEDTIRLLLEGDVLDTEEAEGFETLFSHPDFQLVNSELDNGTLILTFSDVPGFSSGGSCRVTLLRAQVEKTALQFEDVQAVRIEPDSIFQP